MAPSLLRRAMDVLAVDFTQGYGMTELSGNATFWVPTPTDRGWPEPNTFLAAAGRPAPNVEVRVVEDDATARFRPESPARSSSPATR